jgi:hypothetical protein
MKNVRDFIEKYKKKCVILLFDFKKFLQLLRVLRRMKNVRDFIEKYKKKCVIFCVD